VYTRQLTPEQHAKAKEVENQMIDEFGQKK
jgi:hypothetical protein